MDRNSKLLYQELSSYISKNYQRSKEIEESGKMIKLGGTNMNEEVLKKAKKEDIIITIKPNGDILIKAFGDVYQTDIYKAPETICPLNPKLFTYPQLDALHHIRFFDPEWKKKEK